jgi:membrane protease YdiL (CAAX protease family)
MKNLGKFLAVLFVILFVSAFLAPLLFDFLPFKFERIFNRLVMVLTLAAVFAFVRIGRDTLSRFGMDWSGRSFPQFLTAFAGTLVILSALLFFYLKEGCFRWHLHDLSFLKWCGKLSGILLTALVVGILEEFFFRGFIFQMVKKYFSGNVLDSKGSWTRILPAIFLTNIFYSLLHFTSSNKPLIGPDPTMKDSLRLILAPFSSYGDWQTLWPAAFGLFILGCVLNYLVLRSRSLYPAIGAHAGCIFFIKLSGSFADFSTSPSLLFGGAKLYDGVVGWVVLIILGIILGRLIPGQGQRVQKQG